MTAAALHEERGSPDGGPTDEARGERAAPPPGRAIGAETGEGEQPGAEEEHLHVDEQTDEGEQPDGDRVPRAGSAEPAVGEHGRGDTDQLEVGVHPGLATVLDLECADGEQSRGDDPGPPPAPHPPREQRDRGHRAGDRGQAEEELAGAGSGEWRPEQVVEWRV